jgi:hypothetical protein
MHPATYFKIAAEVGFQLLDILLLFGAPHILQSHNGREFTANIIKELKDMWPDCTLVHGKPRHPQSQGSVERGEGYVELQKVKVCPTVENQLLLQA